MAWSKVRRAFRIDSFRPDPASEVDDELAFHFDRTVHDLMGKGMSPDEARREARRRFGDVRSYRRKLGRRVARGWSRSALDAATVIFQTVGWALRGIRRRPGLSTAVIATLALGLGVNVAMFRVLDRLLLSPPHHVEDADRVRVLYFSRTDGVERQTRTSASFPDFQDLQGVTGFASVAAYTGWEMVVGDGTDAELVPAKIVSGGFFSTLGATAHLGRLFGPEDDRPESEPVAVLSWEVWDRAYGRDPAVLGTTLSVGNGRYTLVGVAPRGFTGAELYPVDIWLPLEPHATAERTFPWRESRRWFWMRLVVRLAPGVDEGAALAEATAVYTAPPEVRQARAGALVEAASLVPADDPDAGGEIRVARWLGAVSLIVLLIACANVANLLLTRNLRRRPELAVRAALGIGRRRLVAQLMTETGALVLGGGFVAVALAGWAGSALHSVLLPDFHMSTPMLDLRILGFTGVAMALTVLLAGVLPAMQSSGADLIGSLKSGGERTGTARAGTQAGLLVLQVALSFVLLTGASVFVRSLTSLRTVDLGFATESLALISLHVEGGYSALDEPDDGPAWPPNEIARISELVHRRLASVPGLGGVALVHPTPFMFALEIPFHVPGLDSIPTTLAGGPFPLGVSPEYFDVMELEVVAGRGFAPDDDRFGAQPVTVLNETMARLLWPAEEALGKCVMPGGDDHPCATVIGIVEDSHRQAVLEEDPGMVYYVPIRQQILGGAPEGIFVRTAGAGFAAIREAAQSASPRVRFAHVQPFSDVTGYELRPWRLGAAVLSAFGLLALVVVAFGLYAVFAFEVAGRSRELGIRSALGATRGRLSGLVLRSVALLSGAGIALGFLLAVAARAQVDPLLYDTSAADLRTLLPVGVLLAAVALMAAAVPCSRAARSDPVEVLRSE